MFPVEYSGFVFWLGRRTYDSMVASSITHRRGDGWPSLCG